MIPRGSILPDGPERCYRIADYYFGEDVDERTKTEMVAFNEQVGAEHSSLVEGVQAGLRSDAVANGRLLTESEKLIAHFQRLVYRALTGAHL
jgi:hypothetical protein